MQELPDCGLACFVLSIVSVIILWCCIQLQYIYDTYLQMRSDCEYQIWRAIIKMMELVIVGTFQGGMCTSYGWLNRYLWLLKCYRMFNEMLKWLIHVTKINITPPVSMSD
jgi:hypothetical protein